MKNLNVMSKAELIEHGKSIGISLSSRHNKSLLLNKIIDGQNHLSDNLLHKMIALVLQQPDLVDDEVELRVRKLNLNWSDVLLEIVHSIQIDYEITKESLIAPFSSKPDIVNLLNELCENQPDLSKAEAKRIFSETIAVAELLQQKFLYPIKEVIQNKEAVKNKEKDPLLVKYGRLEKDVERLEDHRQDYLAKKERIKKEMDGWKIVVGIIGFFYFAYLIGW